MDLIAEKVCKKIDDKFILKDINIEVSKGSVYGLIGPNGAGKTTFIRLILNIYEPTSGEIKLNGTKIGSANFSKTKNNISCVMDPLGLYKDLTAAENVEFFHRIYFPKMSKNQRQKAISDALDLFGLSEKANDKINFFSKGERQRLALARASINEPKLLILDEPTTGLDVEGMLLVRCYIKKMKNRGTTVLISSHNLSELEKICDYYGFINSGCIISQGTLEQLQKAYGKSSDSNIELEDIYKEIFNVRQI